MRGWLKPRKRLCLPKSFGVFGFSVGANPKDFSKASFGKFPLLLSRLTCAGFCPGGRACCLARPEGRNLCCGAKGPKTTDTQASFIGLGQRLWMVWRVNSLCSDKPRPFFLRHWPKGLASRRHYIGYEIKLKSYTSTVSGILGSAGRDRCLQRRANSENKNF